MLNKTFGLLKKKVADPVEVATLSASAVAVPIRWRSHLCGAFILSARQRYEEKNNKTIGFSLFFDRDFPIFYMDFPIL